MRTFGMARGSVHPGVLNFGDCLSYGVAMAAGEPLLYKGDDFSPTDVVAAE
jgi:ribonuclease VapC